MPENIGVEQKGFFPGLVDFGFQQSLLRRLVKVLYVIAVLGGAVAVVVCIVLQMQISPSQGLIALVAGIAVFFVWVLLTRLLLELALAVLRIAEGIERATRSGG
jgi:Domain of unknown function (DUF4282)